ncbi:FadR/GntR family transcriptional regulator [Halalkalibacter urbisdiaboli]|uniref:FadR/GntR family transcriptional regulator n=1 Tax=Halalkalibacter urbisdiaboli TaxID=1960589 RepID=UPI000B4552FC|nr:FadR/GntR family transcriptional regulator [Halalkalibacter urbisdiaboli]
MSEQPKRYLEIINEINQIVHDDKLTSGDKLPSERELSDRLQVGRSSVREALRALELLDLIETRRGEGTYIKPIGSYRLVNVILSFLLKDDEARKDLAETRRIVELEALRLACERITIPTLETLFLLINQSKDEWENGDIPFEEDYMFHKTIVEASQNRLLLNLWISLVEYNKVALKESLEREGRPELSIREHEEIVYAIQRKEREAAVSSMRKHLENSRF